MKKFEEFDLNEESVNIDRFDALVRAGLANKAQIQRLHAILEKMHAKDDVILSRADRMIVTNLFNKMLSILTSDQTIFQKAKRTVKEEYEIIEEDNESKKLPVILILKRKAIRLFPNGLKVATYYSDKLKRTFTLPMNDLGMMGVTEEVESQSTVSHKGVVATLHEIVKGKSSNVVKFKDGRSMKVDFYTASAIMQVYDALNDTNKKKINDMLNKDKQGFIKVADFAFSKAKK